MVPRVVVGMALKKKGQTSMSPGSCLVLHSSHCVAFQITKFLSNWEVSNFPWDPVISMRFLTLEQKYH